MKQQLAEREAKLAVESHVRERLAQLLAETAVALKGEDGWRRGIRASADELEKLIDILGEDE